MPELSLAHELYYLHGDIIRACWQFIILDQRQMKQRRLNYSSQRELEFLRCYKIRWFIVYYTIMHPLFTLDQQNPLRSRSRMQSTSRVNILVFTPKEVPKQFCFGRIVYFPLSLKVSALETLR